MELRPIRTKRAYRAALKEAETLWHASEGSEEGDRLEVLTLLGRGRSNAELARTLTLSEATVKTHVARIFAKLELRDRAQAVVLAYETGLVKPGDT